MFVPGKPFKLSLMFACKAGAYLKRAPEMNSTLGKAPAFFHKHKLLMLAIDIYTSLLQTFVNHGRKKNYNTAPGP
jgi:hypothetical protein